MSREVTDADGLAWTCLQAFAGLGETSENAKAAQVAGAPDHVHVVCTPSGGARSVRLQLPSDWQESVDDAALIEVIRAEQASAE